MNILSRADVGKFERDGYLVIHNVFSSDEIELFQRAIRQLKANPNLVRSARNSIVFRGSLFNYKILEHVPFDNRLLEIARTILGDSFVYFGDSSVQTGQGPRGLHRDNVNRFTLLGPDWDGEYPLLRMGIYIGDFVSKSGGLKLVPRSQAPILRFAPAILSRILNRSIRILTPIWKLARDLVSLFQGGLNVPSRSGDVLIWNFRLLHSGNAVKLNRFPHAALPVWLENALPDSWRLPGNQDRMVMFCAFAREGEHLDRYLRSRRESDLGNWKYTRWDEQFVRRAKEANVKPVRPDPEVGSLYGGAEPEESGRS